MFHANRNIPRPASMPLRIAMFFALTTFALTARLYAGYDPCGTVNCHSAYIGYSSGSTGTATVDGAGSKLKAASSFGSNNPNLYVGYSGTGTLNVTNGGVVSSDYCSYIGDLAGSNGTARVEGTGSSWSNYADLAVGYSGVGALDVVDGGAVQSAGLYVGYAGNGAIRLANGGSLATVSTGVNRVSLHIGESSGATGAVMVDGAGSKWTIGSNYKSLDSSLCVGNAGNGTLRITNGGCVNVITTSDCYIGYAAGSKGEVTVDGAGSNLTINGNGNAGSIGFCVGKSGIGTLNITRGATVNYSSFSLDSYIGYGSTGTVTVDGAGSKWINSPDLSVWGPGTLSVTNGGAVSSSNLSVGGAVNIASGGTVASTGGSIDAGAVVTVTGKGSTWTNSGSLTISPSYYNYGSSNSGYLTIKNGGVVGDASGDVGTTGVVNVTGHGSAWTNSGSLSIGEAYYVPYTGYVGPAYYGTLGIANGGTVTAQSVSINPVSMLTMDVGNGSLLNVNNNTGVITNAGTIRLVAGANAVAGQAYSPITAGTWSDSTGVYQAIGGTWDVANHVFVASAVASGVAGTAITIDPSSIQRALARDGNSEKVVEVSFLSSTTTSSINMTADVLDDLVYGSLAAAAKGQSVLAGWQFAVSGDGYTAGTPVYLSMGVGAGHSSDDLTVWHYDGSTWARYAATDLAYDGAYANFTVTGFSGYAVTTLVPEPGPLALLVAAVISFFAFPRRRKGGF